MNGGRCPALRRTRTLPQQRVALARALALEPSVVLLDEPFSALDTALRAATREATAAALRATGATALLVTHDQSEALSFADQLAVLREGTFGQIATPHEVYAAPADLHVAGFLGEVVLVPGEALDGRVRCALGELTLDGGAAPGSCRVMVRPEQIRVGRVTGEGIAATVGACTYYGHDAVLDLRIDAAPEVGVRARVLGADLPASGERVGLTVIGTVRAFPA